MHASQTGKPRSTELPVEMQAHDHTLGLRCAVSAETPSGANCWNPKINLDWSRFHASVIIFQSAPVTASKCISLRSRSMRNKAIRETLSFWKTLIRRHSFTLRQNFEIASVGIEGDVKGPVICLPNVGLSSRCALVARRTVTPHKVTHAVCGAATLTTNLRTREWARPKISPKCSVI